MPEALPRLTPARLASLPAGVARPRYDRAQLRPGIVHLGIGAFHRAHQAWYTEAVLNRFGGDWGIVGVSLRSPGARDQLAPQGGLYSLLVRDGQTEHLQVLGAVTCVLVAPEDPEALIALMAEASIRIVSLTVTEKGYPRVAASGALDLNHPDIQADLAQPERPVSCIGYLVAALRRRRAAGLPGFTALSCDNLPDNGRILERLVREFAWQQDPALAEWIAQQVSFPCTMVDRITPATSGEDLVHVEALLGCQDQGAVVTEGFSQWVIEDHFVQGRPAWEQVGAQLVPEVAVYEKIKLRLLNGSHSLLAYTGCLAGFATVSDAMADPAVARMVHTHMAQAAAPTVQAPEGFDLAAYQQQLCARFANPALKHKTLQIAADGSQKLPPRLLQPLREHLRGSLAGGGQIDTLCLAVAAWFRFLEGKDDQGGAIAWVDPLAARLRERLAHAPEEPLARVRHLVGLSEVFGSDLANEAVFIETTADWLARFQRDGVLASIRASFA